MYLRLVAPVVALITAVSALQVRSPTNGAEWDLSKKHSITWTAASTDPLTFAIELVNLSKYPPFSMKIARSVKTSAGAYTTLPIPNVTPGEAYQFNFMSDDPSKPGILAQSQQFTVLEPTQPFGPPQHEVEEPNTDAETESGSETATEVTDAPSYTPRSNHTASLPPLSSRSSVHPASTGSASVASRRTATTTAKATKSSPPKRTDNAAPTVQPYSGIASLLFAMIALVA